MLNFSTYYSYLGAGTRIVLFGFVVLSIITTGCDMGTYQQRLNSSSPAETERLESES